ncbi:AAA family ATPase [Allonocardiopsis opalescens]|uniref:ATPase AAA-type core domain-containing protein n=1 Tax=Allonocardiopsis opalescens TaxID=1144618 RepID=A0A2T0QAG8_9ACTN|nr:ATP-binding protein [Allonocardiopsis opalescens]PRY00815.1 hypothetical protein CLV72_102447 [Allonocardiopsis opalescens]
MLLRFRVKNHRSLRDEQELSLVRVPRRGEPKPKGGEIPPTARVAGIYGANASGKSNVLDALRWMKEAIYESHMFWPPDKGVPRTPFFLDKKARADPSFYEIDFTWEQVRYSYGFEVTDAAVTSEWLFTFPHGRSQRLFERSTTNEYSFGRHLTGQLDQIRKLTRENSLYLSCAASNNHHLLRNLHHSLSQSIRSAHVGDQAARTSATKQIIKDPVDQSHIDRLLQVADLGISGTEITKSSFPETAISHFENLIKDLEVPEELFDQISKGAREDLAFKISLRHQPTGGILPIDQESDGTQAWLALAGPLLSVLRNGEAFLVDEIDSSLHPMITSTLIRMFKDVEINPRNAQLVFASHDTALLGSMLENDLLERDEVWFTEKDQDGATSLYSLAEFHPRGSENTERGYLQGRYGAVPFVNFADIRKLFIDIHRASDEPAPGKAESAPQGRHA